jgi:hypothetical protein
MNKWMVFFEPFFSNHLDAEAFVNQCEQLSPSDGNHAAKLMMHQTQRLVTIADDIPQLKRNGEGLSLLFLLICVENISKLHDGFSAEEKSRHYVQRFFDIFLDSPDKDKLGNGIIDRSTGKLIPLGLKKAVDFFYNVRCDIVHEGNYWGFSLYGGGIPTVMTNPDVNVYIQFQELRDIIVRGCINAIKDKLRP